MTPLEAAEIQLKFEEMLSKLSHRPAMYVGIVSLNYVSHLLTGYDMALEDAGMKERPMLGWFH